MNETGLFNISLRQIIQQILPLPYPASTVWAYGRPDKPESFSNPTGTVEVTKDKMTTVKWINELVVNPQVCSVNKASPACDYLLPILTDSNGNSVINQAFHWANPARNCVDGRNKTDCAGPLGQAPYRGPTPTVPHVHGAHTYPQYDGYSESWFLPNSSNIPLGFATEGTSYGGPTTLGSPGPAVKNPGYSVFQYPNDQPTTALWFHDHTLGITQDNVYSAGAGFWLIRNENDSEDGLEPNDCFGNQQLLPGPPVKFGQDPNNDLNVRCMIREIPLAFTIRSFYTDGSIYLQTTMDVSTVNGNSWPKLDVAKERYRFRLLNACVSRELLGLYMVYTVNGTQNELPFFVIGADQGMLPQVAIVKRNYAAVINSCGNQSGVSLSPSSPNGLPMGPGERYDVVVDFSDLPDGTVVQLKNIITGAPAEIMQFIVHDDLCNYLAQGQSTGPNAKNMSSASPYNMTLKPRAEVGDVTNPVPRDIAGFTNGSMLVFGDGARQNYKSRPKLWSSPITQNPALNATEIWEFWNFFGASHPFHIHLGKFEIIERCPLPTPNNSSSYPFTGNLTGCSSAFPWESGFKDEVLCPGNTVCRIKMKFDLPGTYMFHCHFLVHEDNQMMRPFCVGAAGTDCSTQFF